MKILSHDLLERKGGRDNKLFQNKMLERDLSENLMDCPHSSCYRQAFEWDLPLHTEYCIHSPSKCFFCEAMVESGDTINHLKHKCVGLEWIHKSEQDMKGSIELIRCLKSSSKTGMKINLSEIQSSFAIILYNLVFMFKKGVEWTIAILEPNKEIQIDIYYTHFKSKVYEFQAILVCNSVKTLKYLTEQVYGEMI